MPHPRIALVVLLICSHPLWSAEAKYPNTSSMAGMGDPKAEWYRACMAVKDVQAPKGDLPTRPVADCAADDLYYDAKGNPASTAADWNRVRTCAFATDDNRVLTMLYANGLGVRRNPALATRYACAVGGAYAEMEGRVGYLSKLKDSDRPTDFDICDHITSGYMAGYCKNIDERREAKARDAWLATLTRKFNPAELKEFNRLRDAMTAFAKHVGDDETDMTGTMRAALSIQAEADVKNAFTKLLETLEKGTLRAYPSAEVTAVDKELNEVYRKLMAAKSERESQPDTIGYSTVTKNGVRETQRSWLRYRDAWARFAKLRYPKVDAKALTGELTKRRVGMLREVTPD